jgi:hypothetical protein
LHGLALDHQSSFARGSPVKRDVTERVIEPKLSVLASAAKTAK